MIAIIDGGNEKMTETPFEFTIEEQLILKILQARGRLAYSELKYYVDFETGSGKFAFYLRKLIRKSLVKLDRSTRMYFIAKIGGQKND